MDTIEAALVFRPKAEHRGIGGGEIVVAGAPAEVAGHADSYTSQFLKHSLAQQPVNRKQAVPA